MITIKEYIAAQVTEGLAHGDHSIDSHKLAEDLLALDAPFRKAHTAESAVTYVQHCLREAEHVCRHSLPGGRYAIHASAVCGADCNSKRDAANKPKPKLCPEHFVALSATGKCIYGCGED